MKRRLLNYFSPHRLGSHRFYFWAHTDLTDLTVFALVGGKSHRCFAFVDGFGLTQIQQIQRTQLLLRNLFNPLYLREIYYNDYVRSVGSV